VGVISHQKEVIEKKVSGQAICIEGYDEYAAKGDKSFVTHISLELSLHN
jgi:hypothetical protein